MVTWQGKRSSALVVRIQEDTNYRFIGVKTLVLMNLLYPKQNPTLTNDFSGQAIYEKYFFKSSELDSDFHSQPSFNWNYVSKKLICNFLFCKALLDTIRFAVFRHFIKTWSPFWVRFLYIPIGQFHFIIRDGQAK